MYERILVPLDGSELAEAALPYAVELGERLGSQITLLYASGLAGGPVQRTNEARIQSLIGDIKQRAEKKQGSIALKELKIDYKITFGDPAKEIVEYANREKISLIIMTTHGRTGFRRLFVGSVADKVVKTCSQPVALIRVKGVRSDMREKDLLDKVLVPLDGSTNSEAVIPYVEELASRLKLEVTFLQVLELDYYVSSETQLKQMQSLRESAQANVKSMAARFKQRGIDASSAFREVSIEPQGVAGEIMKLADEIKADFVMMSTRGRSTSEEKPGEEVENLGSIAKIMVQNGNTPLILVKPEVKKK